MKKISNLFSKKLLFLSGVSAILFAPVFVLADGYGLDATASAAGLKSADLTVLVGNIIGSALSLVGVVFFILMLYGGFVWMIARGKEEKVNKAKDTITAAVIGIIIVFASYALTNFIFSSLEGQTGGGGNNTNNNPNATNLGANECIVPSDCDVAAGFSCSYGQCEFKTTGYCIDPNSLTNAGDPALDSCNKSVKTAIGKWACSSGIECNSTISNLDAVCSTGEKCYAW